MPVDLVRTLTGEGPTITLEIAEDFETCAPASLQLRLRVMEWTDRDAVRVWWDGIELEAPRIDYCRLDNPTPPGGAFQPLPRWREIADGSTAVWLRWDFSERGVTAGEHTVRVVVRERNPQVATPLTLTDVELEVRF